MPSCFFYVHILEDVLTLEDIVNVSIFFLSRNNFGRPVDGCYMCICACGQIMSTNVTISRNPI